MTLEEVICHWQHVEAEATPEFLIAEKSELFLQMSMNVCFVFEELWVLDGWERREEKGVEKKRQKKVQVCLCMRGLTLQRVCFELKRRVTDISHRSVVLERSIHHLVSKKWNNTLVVVME